MEVYSGTGDLFASCITGGLARGTSLTEMMQTAGSFLEKALADSVKEQVPVNEGVNFEKYLFAFCLVFSYVEVPLMLRRRPSTIVQPTNSP